ncbi:hypothetical protein ANN_17238 [Periplaneta americana]|uniref:Uncharacterized protein n=1 Tax=Periplaneta americana TaxID=6978 RepID=A0ABQ8STB0_PERAM|nr:hypothetical protein ANN_17238 [Periplaneta americana]
MAGLCEGGNEPPISLKASNWLFNDAASTTRLFSVYEIGDSEMIFGEMRPRIRHRLPCIHIMVGENLGKNPTRYSAQTGIKPAPERNFRTAGKRLNRLSHAGG